jgi:hypothetical protein
VQKDEKKLKRMKSEQRIRVTNCKSEEEKQQGIIKHSNKSIGGILLAFCTLTSQLGLDSRTFISSRLLFQAAAVIISPRRVTKSDFCNFEFRIMAGS